MRIHRRTDLTLDDLADWLNPIVAGWMRYYGRFYRSKLYPLLLRVSFYLRRSAAEKYKRLRTLQAVHAVVDRAAQTAARPVLTLAVGSRVSTAGEKSPVTGDCHAGIRQGAGAAMPPATRLPRTRSSARCRAVPSRWRPPGFATTRASQT